MGGSGKQLGEKLTRACACVLCVCVCTIRSTMNHPNMYLTLTEVPGLWMVETLDCPKTAQTLSVRWSQRKLRQQGEEDKPLHVMMQVNTSGEQSESHDSHTHQ